jgi:hypothetical protein
MTCLTGSPELAASAGATPLSAYYDNSYVEEIKRSGFLAELWR